MPVNTAFALTASSACALCGRRKVQRARAWLAEIDVRNALRIALEIGFYAHDGYVLETARAEGPSFVTLDGGVRRAADRLGLKCLEISA